MEFFLTEDELEKGNTNYIEIRPGEFDGSFWSPDSIYMHGDIWTDLQMSALVRKVVKEFDFYGITEVSMKEWNDIVILSNELRDVRTDMINDMIPWVLECFKTNKMFTIIGL